MWHQKFGRGFVAVLLLLVLAASPLAALPQQLLTWLSGGKEAALEPTMVPLPLASGDQADLILSLQQSATELQTLLEQQKRDLDELKQKLSNSQATIESLSKSLTESKAELSKVNEFWQVSETSLSSLKADYDVLLAEYNKKVIEAGGLFAKAAKQSDWGGMVGGGVTWDPTANAFGAAVDMGVRFKHVGIEAGAEWAPPVWTLSVPSLEDLKFSVGVKYLF
jgi:uncharacterized coiled-coil protein SlyX